MRNLTILLAAAFLGAAAPWARSQTQSKPANRTPADSPQAPADRLKALQKELNEARKTFMAEYNKTPEGERDAWVKEHPYPDAKNLLPAAWEIVNADPKDANAFATLEWIMMESRGGEDFGKALDIIARDHMKNPKIGNICQNLQYETSDKAERFLEEATKNPDRKVQGIATFSLAKQMMQRASSAQYILTGMDEKSREAYEKAVGAEEFAKLSKVDPKKASARAEELLDRCAKDFADVEMGPKSTVGDMAKAELHEIRDLAIGKPAPEIEAEDLDGVTFKLSDYRGKVVVLDFWGNW
jgi:hypothetical protein